MSIPGAAAPVQALRGRGTTGRRRPGSDARVRAANDRRAAREPHPGSLEDAPPVVTDANRRRRCWQLRQTPSPSLSFSTRERGLRPRNTASLSPSALAVDAQGRRPRRDPEGAQGRHTFHARLQGRAAPRPHPRQVTGKGKGPRPLPRTGGAAAWGDLSARVRPAGAGTDLGSGSGQVRSGSPPPSPAVPRPGPLFRLLSRQFSPLLSPTPPAPRTTADDGGGGGF